MRLSITLTATDPIHRTIPVNYQYPLSAWIYHTIGEGNHAFARFLHDTGFINGTKKYKLFTFSQLSFPSRGFKVEQDRLRIISQQCSFVISFMVPAAIEHFVAGIFTHQHFTLGDHISQTPFQVSAVEVLPEPEFCEHIKLRLVSPLVIGKQVEHCPTAEYLAPDHPDYCQILTDNLIRKYTTLLQAGLISSRPELVSSIPTVKTEILNTPRKWGIIIKAHTPAQTKIIGYTYDFSLTAPAELIKTGYLCGFGEKNALGMGCVEEITGSRAK
ncbi:MAG: CRISPR-associated endoribonuclease Cas6 [Lentimicrobiaceae bacterium]|nr:CRISPR-associated endoribonuclease Cas6 [Lentimicrobiaceae bacterium]